MSGPSGILKLAKTLYHNNTIYKNILNLVSNSYEEYKLYRIVKDTKNKKRLAKKIEKYGDKLNFLKRYIKKHDIDKVKNFGQINKLVDKQEEEEKKKDETLDDIVKEKLRQNRTGYESRKGIIYQKPIVHIPKEYFAKKSDDGSFEVDPNKRDLAKRWFLNIFNSVRPLEIDEEGLPQETLASYYIDIIEKIKKADITILKNKSLEDKDNIYLLYASENIERYINEFLKILFADNTVYKASVQVKRMYIFEGDKKFIRGPFINYTSAEEVEKDKEFTNMNGVSEGSGAILINIGYRILIIKKPGIKYLEKETIMELKAFEATNNRKFHEMTIGSTTDEKICIYETFLDVCEIRELKYKQVNKKNRELLNDMLKNEGLEIEKSVRAGELIKSIELLTTKYNKEVNIIFYNENMKITTEMPININNGVTRTLLESEISKIEGKRVFLYEKNKHVAPHIFKNNRNDKKIKKAIKQLYKLRPITLKKLKQDNKIEGVLGFDFETYIGDDYEAIPNFCVTMYGKLNNKEITKEFYKNENNDVVDEFVNYVISISTKKNNKKSRPKGSIGNIFIYGFNNCNFDNLFIYEKLYEKVPYCKILFTNNSIKYIKFDNIFIYDMSNIYKFGSLRETCKQFKLDEDKGVYPYMFPNKDNLKYIGDVPELKYWNSKEDYDEYIKRNGNSFNLEEYTKKYCLLDSKLVYRLAMIHISTAIGEINGKKYNIVKCPTAANASLKVFQQTFQKDILVQSPDDIIFNEKIAMKGGRTEVFKKYIGHSYKYDINSAHPSGMTLDMPFKFIQKVKYDNYKVEVNDIIDCYLYCAKSKYIGNNEIVIPNLIIKDNKGNLQTSLQTDYSYHWGMELKEAIRNNFEIHINEVIEYEEKPIFKEFIEYFYNNRLQAKKDKNLAMSAFYKNIMNSTYGKFGQKTFQKTVLTKYEDINKIIKDDSTMITDFEVINDKLLIKYKELGDEYNSVGKLLRFSSYIAATTRCKLSEFMRDVGHENVAYCDTDSCFTSNKANERFLSEIELGKWKLEEECKYAIFLGKKCYKSISIDGEVKKAAKGVDKKLIKDNEYNELLNGEKENITVTKNMFFRSLTGVRIKEQERNIKPIYNKRNWVGNDSFAFNNII